MHRMVCKLADLLLARRGRQFQCTRSTSPETVRVISRQPDPQLHNKSGKGKDL